MTKTTSIPISIQQQPIATLVRPTAPLDGVSFKRLLAERGSLQSSSTLPGQSAMGPPIEPGPRARISSSALKAAPTSKGEENEKQSLGREDCRPKEDSRAKERDDAVQSLDPLARLLASNGVLVQQAAGSKTDELRAQGARTASLELAVTSVVRRVAFGREAGRGTSSVLLEIGAGELEGSTILITADPHQVHVALDAPPGIDLEAWKSRLRHRLASEGLTVSFS